MRLAPPLRAPASARPQAGRLAGLLAALVGSIACSATARPASESSSPSASLGRFCTTSTSVTTDTVVDFEAVQRQLGPTLRAVRPPRYPDAMRAKEIEGRVIASYAVDTAGVPIAGTVFLAAETNRAFGDAVCAFLLRDARYERMVVAGRAYSFQLVNVPFDFALGPR